MNMKNGKLDKAVLPIAGLTMMAGVALGAMMPRRKPSMQKTAGKAIKAVGEAVENFSGSLKM
jgi:hypothetical protein